MWLENLARFGCATKGLVYFLIALLSFQLAFGVSSSSADSKGALRLLSAQPFGQIALTIVAFGLCSYTLWRLFEAINPFSFEWQKKEIFKRVGYFFSGISYGGLAFSATRIVLNLQVEDADQTKGWTAMLMSQPFGQILVAMVGVGVFGAGCFYFYRPFKHENSQRFTFNRQEKKQYLWLIMIGYFGLIALGVVFVLIGFFLFQSALQYDPQKAAGLDQILEIIARQPQGKIMLSIVAIGFIGYSLHMCIEARYRDFSSLRQNTKKAAIAMEKNLE